MIKVILPHYELIKVWEQLPDHMEWLRVHGSNGNNIKATLEEQKKSYFEWQTYANSADDVPVDLLPFCKYEILKPLNMISNGRVRTQPLAEALQAYQVRLPGNELLHISEVRVDEDLCTDRLQTLLDEGWMIVAVCPQPGQRRPDYVLGKFKEPEEPVKYFQSKDNPF